MELKENPSRPRKVFSCISYVLRELYGIKWPGGNLWSSIREQMWVQDSCRASCYCSPYAGMDFLGFDFVMIIGGAFTLCSKFQLSILCALIVWHRLKIIYVSCMSLRIIFTFQFCRRFHFLVKSFSKK